MLHLMYFTAVIKLKIIDSLGSSLLVSYLNEVMSS